MKRTNRITALLLCFILMLPGVGVFASDGVYKEYYVSYNTGNDSNDGLSIKTPFKTVKCAKEAAKAASSDMTGDIVINLMEGNHFLDDTLYFEPSDSGKNGHRIIYRGNGNAVISGGTKVQGFAKSPAGEGIYEAKLPGQDYVYSMFINGAKRTRAASEKMIKALANWDDPETSQSGDGLYISKDDLGIFDNADEMQFMWFSGWMQCYVGVEEILPDLVNHDRVIARMDERVWNVSGAKYRSLGLPFFMQNAMELMDTPGEFYFNKDTDTLYYIPEDGEDIATAEVIVPKIEKLMDFYGASEKEKVENISFDGITFAHTKWDALESQSTTGTQAQMWGNAYNDIDGTVPGAIELRYTKNISFKNNVFNGLQQVGIFIPNAAENTEIVGNAFINLGDAAVVVGLPGMRDNYQSYNIYDDSVLVNGRSPDVPSGNIGMRNIAFDHLKIATSHYSRVEAAQNKAYIGVRSYYRPLRNWVKESDYEVYDGTWHSDPNAVGKEKAWVRYDLGRYYTLSELHLLFDPEETDERQRRGYEILLSNDRDFQKYDLVAKQTEDSGSVAKFTVPAELKNNKYRYVMVRTLGATQFALSDMYIFTEDLKPCRTWERCNGVTITNNLISGVGQSQPCSGGLNIFSGEEIKLSHNEFRNLPYSAIMVGWGWVNQYVATNNIDISHNFIDDVCKTLNDGAGIYTLGRQYGTVVHDNFVNNIAFGKCAYYLDEGTSSTLWENNVALGINSETFFLNVNAIENTVRNIYSDTTTAGYESRAHQNTISPVVEIPTLPVSGYDDKVRGIIENAGLEAEYQHLRKYISGTEMKLPIGGDLHKTADSTIRGRGEERVKKLLTNGKFGTKPGELSYDYLFELKRVYSECNSASDKNAKAQQLLNVAGDVYNNFNKEESKAEGIACIYADGALSMELDFEKREARLRFPASDTLKGKNIDIVCTDGYRLAYKFAKRDLVKPVKIPLKNKSTGKYEMWTLISEKVIPVQRGTVHTADKWYIDGDNVKIENGAANLKSSYGTYISAVVPDFGKEATLTFAPGGSNVNGRYSFVIGSKDDSSSVQFEISIAEGNVSLKKLSGGETVLLSQKPAGLKTGKNILKYSINKEAGKTVIRATLNDTVEIHAVSAEGPDSCITSFVPSGTAISVY